MADKPDNASLYGKGASFSCFGSGEYSFGIHSYNGPRLLGIAQFGSSAEVLLTPEYAFRAAAMLGARALFQTIHVTREKEAEKYFGEKLQELCRHAISQKVNNDPKGENGYERLTYDELFEKGLLVLRK